MLPSYIPNSLVTDDFCFNTLCHCSFISFNWIKHESPIKTSRISLHGIWNSSHNTFKNLLMQKIRSRFWSKTLHLFLSISIQLVIDLKNSPSLYHLGYSHNFTVQYCQNLLMHTTQDSCHKRSSFHFQSLSINLCIDS